MSERKLSGKVAVITGGAHKPEAFTLLTWCVS